MTRATHEVKTKLERPEVQAAAASKGLSLSAYVRMVALEAAKKEARK